MNQIERFRSWGIEPGDQEDPPAYFGGSDMPHGFLPKTQVVLQYTDYWFDSLDSHWRPVPEKFVGKWGDECFDGDAVLYGFLPRFSDAIHESRFQAAFNREKPPKLSSWDG